MDIYTLKDNKNSNHSRHLRFFKPPNCFVMLFLLHLITLASVFQLSFGSGFIECYQCDNLTDGCDQKPPRPDLLHRCPDGTQMCYIRVSGVTSFDRGCLAPHEKHWEECMVMRDNNCLTCYGTGCNNMELWTEISSLFCVQCKGVSGCEKASLLQGNRCPNRDSIFGPAMCTTKYKRDGSIELKDCWENVDRTGEEYKRNKLLYFNCHGHMCNFQNKDSVQRCLHDDLLSKFNRSVTSCYSGGPRQLNMLSGCFREEVESKTGTSVKMGCNSYNPAKHIHECLGSESCQLCYGNMCNDNAIRPFFNTCYNSVEDKTTVICDFVDSKCFVEDDQFGIQTGCVSSDMDGLYNANVLMCSNSEEGRICTPTELIQRHLGCYECSHPPCDDVLVTLGYAAKTICPLGTEQCYSARRADGVTFRGCYSGISEGVKVCKDTMGACRICSGNYCNHEKLARQTHGQCYKSNWRRADHHETSLRFADCQGSSFYGSEDTCYIASSSRLFMRMGCLSELVSGIDESYAVKFGGTWVAWLYQNKCYKCESNAEGYCFDVNYLQRHTCRGLTKLPVRGCYTLTDRRSGRLERGCITELSEYMLRLCNMPIFFEKCFICQGDGCNRETFAGF